MNTWWTSRRPGTDARVVLIQFDLKGHTAWAEKQPTERDSAQYRTEFALGLRSLLSYKGFDPLYWLGDGGVFALDYNGKSEEADAAIAVADSSFEYFKRFQEFTPGAKELSLRATATLVEVILHPEASHWYGIWLNNFLKYEREMGLADAFVITGQLYQKIDDEKRKRFPKSRLVVLPNKNSVTLYTDTMHQAKPETESEKRFMLWLQKYKNKMPSADKPIIGRRERDVVIGEAVVVNTAPNESGYSQTILTETEFDWSTFHEDIIKVDGKWNLTVEKSKSEPGIKAAPLRVTVPTTESSSLVIEYAKVNYGIAQPFHKLLLKRPDLRERFGLSAFKFQYSEGRLIPGILGVHAVVLLDSESISQQEYGVRYLLLAHRVYRQDGYFSDVWSASFEEQFSPVESNWGGRHREADVNLHNTVARGLKEEFFTDQFDISASSIKLPAIFIDGDLLNLQMMAVVSLPSTPFSKVKALWPNAEDSQEHDALAVLPLKSDTLWKAMTAKGPEGLMELYSGSDPEGHSKHVWHPTSKARIACCLWMLEEGLL
ncbi:MAG: hypothetical protein HZA00_04040 [Nitrospinae bacterium]|nr:hypothetical protein [Nitrospinota bacterium]